MKRRQFLQGTAAAGLIASAPFSLRTARAAEPRKLVIANRTIEVNGKSATVYSLTDSAGKPGLTFAPGERFLVNLDNRLSEETIIHWHGLTPPYEQDGVPDNPLPLLKAGETRAYDFAIEKPGTFWMHAHTLQEQNLLAAPLIVHSAEDLKADRQEVVVLLHDFSFKSPEELLAGLGGAAHGMNHGAMDHGSMDMGDMDMGGMDHGNMNHGMGGMDLNDIQYDAYLANDRTLDDPEVISVEPGGKVLLRIINGAASTAFHLSTGSLAGTLVAVDGRPVQPVAGTLFPATMAQRLDILIDIPKEQSAWPILALREGAVERTGIILAADKAAVTRVAKVSNQPHPPLDLGLESSLVALEPLPVREADRSAMVHLMGNMMPYQWGMMGLEGFSPKVGERIEFAMMNMSMMAHPMHMHGHDFQVVGINGTRLSGAVRDTVMVPPMTTVTIAVDFERPGNWPFHCHHLYHMVTGMMVHLPVST